MKRCPLCLIIILVLVASAHPQARTDEVDILALPQKFVAAWAKHDGHELGNIMAENVDFVNVGGDWLHGRPDFELYHTRLLSGPFKKSSLMVLDTAVSFLRPDIAILHWTWVIKGDGMEDPTSHEPRKGIFTMLVEKHGREWLIRVSQNTNQMTGPNPELEGIKPPLTFPATK